MPIKVLMLGRIGLLEDGGGDRIQVENTAEELGKLGVEVSIKTDLNFDPRLYDIVHVFQLDWTPETYLYAKKVKKFKKPLVLSPIHHNVEEVKKFDDIYVFDFRKISKVLFKNQFHRDTFKNVYRSIFDLRKAKPTFFSIVLGFKNTQRQILEWSDIVLVQTGKEAEDLVKTFGVNIKWKKVSNGVSKVFEECTTPESPLGFNDYILCVGRIEPRKNQLNIVKAVEKLRNETARDLKLVFIGPLEGKKHFEYSRLFLKEVQSKSWITYIGKKQSGKVSHVEIPPYFKFAKVCVSASWFETTGLTSLEALICGTNAVASGERAKECLGDYASYCQPDDIDSIKEAIKKEYFAPRPVISDELKSEYTWENAAKKTLEAYNSVLAK